LVHTNTRAHVDWIQGNGAGEYTAGGGVDAAASGVVERSMVAAACGRRLELGLQSLPSISRPRARRRVGVGVVVIDHAVVWYSSGSFGRRSAGAATRVRDASTSVPTDHWRASWWRPRRWYARSMDA